MLKQLCEFCGKSMGQPDVSYRMKIELYADPAPPEFTQEDLERDVKAEMEALFAQMESADAGEAEDEVYESYLFTLCGHCRGKVHHWLRERHEHLDDLGLD
ncbi:TPA: hypothetical protein DDW35_08695 [Candidatus Sumerlaeota bacterium]|jgi:hypothetical protein|nr:hypothetical protein [Candidatus Sumerlaeota bacterium]